MLLSKSANTWIHPAGKALAIFAKFQGAPCSTLYVSRRGTILWSDSKTSALEIPPTTAPRVFLLKPIRDKIEDINLSGLVACGGSPDQAARCLRTAGVHFHMKSRLSNCPQHLALPSRREL